MRTRSVLARLLFFFTAAVLWSVSVAEAQQRDHGNTVMGSGGFGSVWNDETRLGEGASFTGGVELRLSPALGLLFDFTHYTYNRTFDSGHGSGGGLSLSGNGSMLAGSMVYHFAGARSGPFILAGLAYISSETESRNPIYDLDVGLESLLLPGGGFGPPPRIGEEVSQFSEDWVGASIGAGSPRLALRPEGRVLVAGALEFVKISASLGVSYRW